ncbi:MoaD/ThiS family protein [Daejeonella lutea]|uniref:Molybdopterin synthase sulfur carrier subunit n=1 Tax=Daejeonella lutea TaxID=572036 RepID=A0A1T4ZXR0_9SPHI|nr:MoaD/ThiS family protein [Daejeonella lutea]SKB27289.1 molybdopterin synthase sulfur carrier subunit [Daejeonella lutea]
MQVKVLIFGQLTDITGVSELQLNDVSDRDELITALNRQYPGLADSKYAIAVNKQVINENIGLTDNSTVALLPPFSGG